MLQNFGLDHLLEATDQDLDKIPSLDWVKKLSPGEKQTLAFVRLIYHCPKVAFLDEASSALSIDSEAKLYEECLKKNIQIISIGHRPTLRNFHDKILLIGLGNGAWKLEDIEKKND